MEFRLRSFVAVDTDDHSNRESTAEQHVNARAVHGVKRGHVVVAVKLMRERLAEPWTLGALAEAVHLSRSQLFRCFDATVEMSPLAYLRKMRVERMARLLASTDLSVAEVARAVGWTDPSYASRCFHAAYGVSPTEYRYRQTVPPLG
jgi:transcriptional regulator GlxA family with amidase domain